MGIVAALACQGGAFSISQLGVRAAGMGTAFIAVADDSSAIFYNPAGIAFQQGTYIEVDGSFTRRGITFTPSSLPQGGTAPAGGFSGMVRPDYTAVGSLFATHQLSKKLTAGFGFFSPFNFQTNFTSFADNDPVSGRFTARFAGTRQRMESYWFQPTVAYKLTENSAIALGPALVHTHLFMERSFFNPQSDALSFSRQYAATIFPGVPVGQAAGIISRLLPEGRSRIAASANAPAIAAGYLYKNAKLKTSVGATYRSATVFHLEGDASFGFTGSSALDTFVPAGFLPAAFPAQKVQVNLTLPATYGVGIANSSLFGTTLAFDFRFQDYERFRDVTINYASNVRTSASIGLPAEERLVYNFRNGYDIALGAMKSLGSKTEIRLGYLHDRTPVPDSAVGPFYPDADSDSFTLGGTRKIGRLDVSFFYQAEFFQQRTTSVAANATQYTNGIYDNSAHIFGVSVRGKVR